MKSLLLLTVLLASLTLACTDSVEESFEQPQTVSSGRVTQAANTISFSGLTWIVKDAAVTKVGPGPNLYSKDNVWVDTKGKLHLKIRKVNDTWTCAEIYTQNTFGNGQYQFWIESRIDQLDKNVVLGLFNYPCSNSDCEPDYTHEMDIEFARWGNASANNLNYTVWPAVLGGSVFSQTYPFSLAGKAINTTHRFTRKTTSVLFQSLYGFQTGNVSQFATKTASSPPYSISTLPMSVYINLWLFQGNMPSNQEEVEVIINNFKFKAL